jgi:hypothetical protein
MLTQNAFAGSAYLDYLRLMHGSRIYVPTTNDLQIALSGYLAEAQVRLDHNRRHPDEPQQMKPGVRYDFNPAPMIGSCPFQHDVRT